MSGPTPAADDDPPARPQPGEEPEAGILGNLPRNRPSVRSPRRAETSRASAAVESGAPRAEAEGQQDAEREIEVEALARAGVSLATGAATLGLRVAGRAASALRDAVERR